MPDPASTNAPADAVHARALGVLALELTPGHAPKVDALPPSQAGELAHLVGRDLAGLVEGAHALDLVLAGAHFDPAEVLRPGWPLHRRLRELHQSAPRGDEGARVFAFGADPEGAVPQPLQAERDLAGGALRVLPFLLAEPAATPRTTGDHAAFAGAVDAMEQVLLDRGMVQPGTALLAQEAFGARIEHARYLTVHDLAAMTALQYRNQGLEGLWSVVEAALLRPDAALGFDAPPEPLLRYAEGEARIAMLPPGAWRHRHDPRGAHDEQQLERHHELYQARQRQYAAILGAHGIPVSWDYTSDYGTTDSASKREDADA